jgi:sec-independent protein translocase protein TatC
VTEPEDPFEKTRMTLGEHLEELRRRLIRSLVVFVVAFVAAWFLRTQLTELIRWPFEAMAGRYDRHVEEHYARKIEDHPEQWSRYFTTADPATRQLLPSLKLDTRLLVTDVGEQFVFALNVSLAFALFLGSPFFLWQMWQFIAAGLYEREKRGVRRAFPFSVALFLAGVLFAFFTIVPMGMYFLQITLDPEQANSSLRLGAYFGFVRTLCLAMGVVFQLPVLMVFAARYGLIEPRTFARYRGHWVVGALIVAAFLTPGPDFYSQLLMAAPMLVLYEIGILIGRVAARPRGAARAADARP